jgi:uncharacterized membrane protein
MTKPQTIGNKIAPWRFIVFFVMLIVGSALAIHVLMDDWLGLIAGFDIAAAVFLLTCVPLLFIRDPLEIERLAAKNDANRTVLLVLTGIVIVALLIAIGAEVVRQRPEPTTALIIIATLVFAWLFSNIVYSLHYAHMAYVQPKSGCHGLDFPATPLPIYWDFVYFAFTIGMTFQTSDVTISNSRIRRVVTVHSFAAFIFNIGVLAFTINAIGSV